MMRNKKREPAVSGFRKALRWWLACTMLLLMLMLSVSIHLQAKSELAATISETTADVVSNQTNLMGSDNSSGEALPASGTNDDYYTIDVMVLYTPKAAQHVGENEIQNRITQSIEEANTTFDNPKAEVKIRFRLVLIVSLIGFEETETRMDPNTGTGGLYADLANFTNMTQIQTLRDEYKADLVQLVVNNEESLKQNYWGVGHQAVEENQFLCSTSINTNDLRSTTYTSVSQVEKILEPHYTLAHEFGHNMGATHSCGTSLGNGWYSIMKTNPMNAANTRRLPRWSDENAERLNQTACYVANYRTESSMPDYFCDVPADHEFYDAVQCLAEHRITIGIGNGDFAPDRSVNRGEAARFIARWLGKYDSTAQYHRDWSNTLPPYQNTFSDIANNDGELQRATQALYWKGIANSFGSEDDPRFSPDSKLDRGTALGWIIKAMKKSEGMSDREAEEKTEMLFKILPYPAFSDLTFSSYEQEILLGQALRITNGYEDPDDPNRRVFRPLRGITRGEFAALLFRTMGIVGQVGLGNCPQPPNFGILSARQATTTVLAREQSMQGPLPRPTYCFPAAMHASLPNVSIPADDTLACYRFSDESYYIIEDVEPHDWANRYIRALYDTGISEGCERSGGTRFCPEQELSRTEMAIFLLRAKHFYETGDSGLNYPLPPAGEDVFVDVSSDEDSPFYSEEAAWINELFRLGITQGSPACRPEGDTRRYYCPEDPVKRNQMALFLLRTLEGAEYVPSLPYPLGIFEDVPASTNEAVAAIEELYWRGITHGAGECEEQTEETGLLYCPEDVVDRAHAAAFLVRTFIEPPTPTERLGDLCFSTSSNYEIPRFIDEHRETPGIPAVGNEDIVCYHRDTNQFKMYFNGSTHDAQAINIDALSIPSDGEIWFSIASNGNIPDIGNVGDEDVIVIQNGSFSLAIDGSQELASEDIDALHRSSPSNIYLSTINEANFGFTVEEEDIVHFNPNNQDFNEFFDGSLVNLTSNINGASVTSDSSSDSTIYMTLDDASFCLPNATGEVCGEAGDVVRFTGTTGSETSGLFSPDLCFDSSTHQGLEEANLDAIDVTGELDCEPPAALSLPPAILETDASSLTFTVEDDNQTPAPQSFTITNSGESPLQWQAVENASWLHLNSETGTAPSTVEVSVDPTGLDTGIYEEQIRIFSEGALNSPWVVTARLYLGLTSHNIYLPAVMNNPTGSSSSEAPDLIVTSLSITSQDSDSISYSYVIKNVGDSAANLDGPTEANDDNVSVQAFLSEDTVFNNNGDLPAGGTILGASPLGNLEPEQTFSGSFEASTSVDPASMNYLTLMVDWGEVVDESDEANNTIAVPIPEVSKPDLIVTSLSITSQDSESISYSYVIKNVGDSAANLDGPTDANDDNVSVQAFLSEDTVFNNNGDLPAGGTILGASPLGNLEPEQTFSGSFEASTSVDPASMNYLILMVDWGEVVDESDEGNNTIAVPIPEVSKPDLIVTSLSITSQDSESISYSYVIKNVGDSAANLDQGFLIKNSLVLKTL